MKFIRQILSKIACTSKLSRSLLLDVENIPKHICVCNTQSGMLAFQSQRSGGFICQAIGIGIDPTHRLQLAHFEGDRRSNDLALPLQRHLEVSRKRIPIIESLRKQQTKNTRDVRACDGTALSIISSFLPPQQTMRTRFRNWVTIITADSFLHVCFP